MGGKYEVFYWDYNIGREVISDETNSFVKAYQSLLKLEEKWYCVGIRFRRNKVKEN